MRKVLTVMLFGTLTLSMPVFAESVDRGAQISPSPQSDAWAELSAVPADTRIKLTFVDGSEVTGKLVQVTTDSVKLKEYQTGTSGVRTSSGSSPEGEMTFLRSQVRTIEIPTLARVQSIAFADLGARLKAGDKIYVTDTAGNQATGRLVGIGPSAVRVRVEGTEREWAAANVKELGRRSDSPFRGGSFWGLGIGAGLTILPAIAFRTPGPIVAGAMFGYGIGVGIDAAFRHRQPLYRPSLQGRVSVTPMLTRDTQGARIAFRF